ncbi:TRAP transporter small permease [Oricola indica]|jgi:TRAP-type C4-dicarboxylate transport system permease small subunit|uniref:TRAP transporter small permease n=1 Tax=Oricola indica TaxID=2872591 RepID=UPI001CBFCA12|nr:TRAP transporter small permease [Oricola indica]
MRRKLVDFPLEDWLGSFLLFCLLVLMGLNVILRYLFDTGIAWSEEIGRYLLIYIVYLGISTGIRRDSHIHIELAERILSATYMRFVTFVRKVAVAIFLGVVMFIYFDLIGRFSYLKSPSSQISMSYFYASVFIGCAFGLVRLVLSLGNEASGDRNES